MKKFPELTLIIRLKEAAGWAELPVKTKTKYPESTESSNYPSGHVLFMCAYFCLQVYIQVYVHMGHHNNEKPASLLWIRIVPPLPTHTHTPVRKLLLYNYNCLTLAVVITVFWVLLEYGQ